MAGTVKQDFFIILNLQELNALRKCTALAYVAYIHFKRNINFATGTSNKRYSRTELSRLLTPEKIQGQKHNQVTLSKLKGTLKNLADSGLLVFDNQTLNFSLPMHQLPVDEVPKKTAKSSKKTREAVRKSSGSRTEAVPPPSPAKPIGAGLAEGVENKSYGSCTEVVGKLYPNTVDSTKELHDEYSKNSLSSAKAEGANDALSQLKTSKPDFVLSSSNLRATPCAPSSGLPSNPSDSKRSGGEVTPVSKGSAEWFRAEAKTMNLMFWDNPKSKPYYANWARLFKNKKMNEKKFKDIANSFLNNPASVTNPYNLDKAITATLKPLVVDVTRRALGRGDLVL
jgi:hypothetical protein